MDELVIINPAYTGSSAADAAGLRTAGQSAKKAECDNADSQSVKCECVSGWDQLQGGRERKYRGSQLKSKTDAPSKQTLSSSLRG